MISYGHNFIQTSSFQFYTLHFILHLHIQHVFMFPLFLLILFMPTCSLPLFPSLVPISSSMSLFPIQSTYCLLLLLHKNTSVTPILVFQLSFTLNNQSSNQRPLPPPRHLPPYSSSLKSTTFNFPLSSAHPFPLPYCNPPPLHETVTTFTADNALDKKSHY